MSVLRIVATQWQMRFEYDGCHPDVRKVQSVPWRAFSSTTLPLASYTQVNRLVSELRQSVHRERALRRFAAGQTAIRDPAFGHQAGHERPLVLEAPACGTEL